MASSSSSSTAMTVSSAPGARERPYVEGPSPHADGARFYTLCGALEKSRKATGKANQRMRFFFNKKLVDRSTKQTMYPLVRLIIPHVDRARKRYGTQETKLKMLVREAIGLRRDSAAGKMIEHFKDAKFAGPNAGRLPLVVESVLKDRGAGKAGDPTLTVRQVNDALDALSRADNDKARQRILMSLIEKSKPVEFKWIMNIIIGDKMNIHVRHETFLRALHDDAPDQFNSHLDLRRVCAECRDPEVHLRAEVRLFEPFKPMLGHKPKANTTCIDGFGVEPFALEPKLDGERLLVHWTRRDPGAAKLYSRQGTDLGEKYGYNHALQTQLGHALLADECIVDGELVLYDQTTGTLAPFGNNRTSAAEAAEAFMDQRRHESDKWLCFMVFDLIYVRSSLVSNDRQGSLTGLTYQERRELLHRVVRQTPNKVEIVEQTIVYTEDKVERLSRMFEALEDIMQERGEGLMLKRLSSTYDLDKRRPESWVKVKPEYFTALSDDLDVIVLGGYFPDGHRRAGGSSRWMLGVAKDPTDGGWPTQFYGFGKVGTGYSQAELERMRSELKAGEHPWTETPEHLMGWKPAKASDRPDFWYEPSKSLILTVAGAEIVQSANWSSQYVIRFPRVKRIRWREDKPWHECLRFTQLREIYEANRGALSRSRLEAGRRNGAVAASKKPAKRPRTAVGTVPAQFTAVARAMKENANTESNLFTGDKVHVIPFHAKPPTEFRHVNGEHKVVGETAHLASLMKNNGATYFVTPPRKVNLNYVLVHKSVSPHRLQNIIELDTIDVIFMDWALRSLARGERIAPKASDYYYMSRATRVKFGNIDKFGDHLTEETTPQALKAILSRVTIPGTHTAKRPKRGALSASSSSSSFMLTPERAQSMPATCSQKSVSSPTTRGGRGASRYSAAYVSALKYLLEDEDDPMLTYSTPLRGCVLYLDKYTLVRTSVADEASVRDDTLQSRLAALGPIARIYGARVEHVLTDDVTHVVMDPASPCARTHLEELEAVLKLRRRAAIGNRCRSDDFHIVTCAWVDEVIQRARLLSARGTTSGLGWEHLDEADYHPRRAR